MKMTKDISSVARRQRNCNSQILLWDCVNWFKPFGKLFDSNSKGQVYTYPMSQKFHTLVYILVNINMEIYTHQETHIKHIHKNQKQLTYPSSVE